MKKIRQKGVFFDNEKLWIGMRSRVNVWMKLKRNDLFVESKDLSWEVVDKSWGFLGIIVTRRKKPLYTRRS